MPNLNFSVKTLFSLTWLYLLLSATEPARAQILFIGAYGEDDYVAGVLKAALQHTETEYGKVELQTRQPASVDREENMLRSHPDDMRIAKTASSRDFEKDPDFIVLPVPLMRGIVGYRICFSSPKIAQELNQVSTIEHLKKYTFGVGNDWHDRQILDVNQLKNIGVGYHFLFDEQVTSLYNMTAIKRVDILCRGINEAYGETRRYPVVKKTALNTSFALHYEIPIFIYMHKNHQKLLERLTIGFEKINTNGEFQKLWEAEFLESVQFANMKSRKIIHLDGGNTEIPVEAYEHFLYRP